MGVLLITIAYEVYTPGSTGSFRKDDGMRLAGVATIFLPRLIPCRLHEAEHEEEV